MKILQHRDVGQGPVQDGLRMLAALALLPAIALSILLTLASSPPVAAATAHEHAPDRLEHRRWLSSDGGPSQVGAIANAADGYLWLGTNDSLVRFDGLRFRRHPPGARGAPAIVSSLLAQGDALWVGLRSGGVALSRPGAVLARERGPDAPAGVVYGLAQDRSQAIWVAAEDGLARRANGAWRRIGRDQGFDEAGARAVFVDRGGVLWAAGEHTLYYLRDGDRRFTDTGLRVDGVSQIAQAPDGALWLAERRGSRVHRVVLEGGALSSGTARLDAPATSLAFDGAGGLWLGTTGRGLLHVARPDGLAALAGASRFTARQGLSSDFVWRLHLDAAGNLWVGTNAGLDRFRPRILAPSAFPPDALNVALAAGPDGSMWGGPGSGSALRLQEGRMQALPMPAPVNSAIRDAEGGIWMAGPAGIWRAPHRAQRQLEFVADLPPGAAGQAPVRAMARDGQGVLWVSINKVGLFRLEAGGWAKVAGTPPGASQRMPVSALAAPDGWLWFGYRDGLLEARRDGRTLRWTQADGLGHVTALAHHAGRSWVGGQHGLAWVEAGRLRRLALPGDGMFDNIYAIVPVPTGDGRQADLWLHARAGIFQLPAAELAHAMARPGHRIRYRSFDALGGLANDPHQVLPLPTAVRASDGRLWFSTGGGVVSLDPARLPPAEPGPPVEIEAVSVDGARLAPGAPLSLGSGVQRIAIDYTAPSLAAPERLSFRYRLDGFDTDWVDAGRARQAIYTGLAPGAYAFRVVALNKDGVPSPREAVLQLRVARAFYRHPLFLAGAGLLLLAALRMVYRTTARRAAERVRDRLQERHRERERIARELHDTLLQGVHGLVLRFQAAADMLPSGAPARAQLEQALVRADQVLVEGRDRVRALRGGPLDTRELHEALAAAGEELAAQWDCGFAFALDGTVRRLQPGILDEVYRIGHEALRNAFAHARAAQVTVDVAYRRAAFVLTVADDGCGIDPSWLAGHGRPDHWGLRGMRERAERIGARLEIHGGAGHGGRGTRVVLTLSARIAYRGRPFWRRGWLRGA
ncbi:sensor histidine kinase [Massilia sp. CFBP9026]|uniref:sensor histidine kinase n=1 Tax=Massilia sp. CFBP9026 TaxID=3096536 RepID=UPI002A6AB5C5|nr:two-component regulator propeller domain-containing protein [Massilia sp. CFBP9026]MDY0963966.1 two-component regulator propeller domain-containing protein [Massilia sp. CFBP9026]